MHLLLLALLATTTQAPGKWPPDSLINTKVIPHNTPVTQVVGTMRNFTSMLGVRCHTCHEGEEGTPLEKTDFASDKKRMKLVARQMMRMVEEIKPGPQAQSDDQLLDHLRRSGGTGWHQVGTCRMGSDAQAVVDAQTRQYRFGPVVYFVAFLMALVSPTLSVALNLAIAVFFALPLK